MNTKTDNAKSVILPLKFLEAVTELLDTADRNLLTAREWELVQYLQAEVDRKAAAAFRRELFGQYKQAAPGEGRERLRKEYLDESCIGSKFRSVCECRDEPDFPC